MRRIIFVLLSFATVSGALAYAADQLPNPFAASANSRPAFVVIGNTVAEKERPIFDVVEIEMIAVGGNKPMADLFANAVTRDLQRDTILLTARTTALIFLDANKKPIAAFLYRSRARVNKKVLEPIAVTQSQSDGNYSYQLMSEQVAKMQGVTPDTASHEQLVAATSVRYIPVSDLVERYAGDDVTDAFPRSLVSSMAK